jgi:large subunit ribosomal protein L10e
VLRENKQATGAGADRVSEGMRLAFGKAVGTAARVEAGQIIFTVYSNAQYLDKIKAAMRNGAHKLPTPSHLKVHTIKVSGRIIAAPKIAGDKIAEPVKVEAETEAVAAEAAAKGAEAAKGADHKGGKGPAKAEPAKAEPAAKGAEAAKGADHKGGAHKGGKK